LFTKLLDNMKDIRNYNSKEQSHGYQEIYLYNDKLYYRGNWKNGKCIGYEEYLYSEETNFCIR
jgi:hypothetical protein